MPYFIYIIQSEVDFSFYTGYTSHLEKRILDHNEGLSRYTSAKKPWKLVYHDGAFPFIYLMIR